MPTTLLYRARNTFGSTKCRLLRRPDALGAAARRGQRTAGDPAARVPGWFRVGSSNRAGSGVFALRPYTVMEPIVMGIGVITHLASSSPTHSFDMRGAGVAYSGLALDCSADNSTNTIKYFNSAGDQHNAEVFWHSTVPVVYATQPIPRGQEILLSYTF